MQVLHNLKGDQRLASRTYHAKSHVPIMTECQDARSLRCGVCCRELCRALPTAVDALPGRSFLSEVFAFNGQHGLSLLFRSYCPSSSILLGSVAPEHLLAIVVFAKDANTTRTKGEDRNQVGSLVKAFSASPR